MANSSFRNDKRTFKNARETGNTEDLYARKASVQLEEQKRQRAEAEQNAAQEHAQRQRGIFRNLMGGIKEGITGEIDRKRQDLYDSWGTMPNALGTVGRAMKNSLKYGGPAPKGTKNKKDESSNDGSSSAEMNAKFNKLDGELKKQNTLVTDSIRKIDGKLEDILLATNRIDANINKLIYMMNNMPRQNNNVPVLEQPQKEPQPRDPRTGRFLPRNGARPAPRPTPPQTAPRTSTMSRVGMGVGRALGTGMLGVGTGLAAYDEYTQSGNAGRAGFVGGGALAGMIAGGKLGAMGGAFAGLPGAFVGGIAGSAIGGIAGSSLGRSLYDSIGGERAPSIAGGLLSSTTTSTERNLRGAENQTEALRNAANEIRVETNMYNINVKDSVTITAGGKIEFKGSEIVFNSAKITNNSQTGTSQGGGSGGGVGGTSHGSQGGSGAGSNGSQSGGQSPSGYGPAQGRGGSGAGSNGSQSGGQSPSGYGPAQGQGGTNQGPFINGQLAGGLGPAPNFTTGTPSSGGSSQSQPQQGVVPNSGSNRILMANQGSVRNQDISATLRRQLNYAATQAGVHVEVHSGGQDGIGQGRRRLGSTRHDHGNAADVRLYRVDENGRKQYLSMRNPQDAAIMEKFTREAVRAGATGVGAGLGYMGDRSIHIGGGSEASWGGADWIGRAHAEGRRNRINLSDWEKQQAQNGQNGQSRVSEASPEAAREVREDAYRNIFSRPRQGQLGADGQQTPQGQTPIQPQTPQQFFGPNVNVNNLPAGMRNNNPGNLKFNPGVNWEGSLGPSQNTDQGTPQVMFNSPISGMRAMARLAMNKYGQGLRTVEQIIGDQQRGWTPGHAGAIANIAKALGVRPNEDLRLDNPENLRKFMRALITQEHGPSGNKYTDAHIMEGIQRARTQSQGQGGSPHPIHGANRVRGGGQGQTPAPQGGSPNDSNNDGKFPPVQGFGDDAAPSPNARGPIPNLNNPALSQPPRPVPGGYAQPGPLLNDAESRRGRAFNQTRVPYQDQVPPDLKMIEAEREMRRVGLLGDNEAQRGRAFNQVNSGAPRFAPMPILSPVDRRGPETDDLVARLQAEEWKKAQEYRALMEHAERQATIVNEVNQTGSLINQRATDQAIAQSRQGSNVNVVQSSEPPRATTPSLGNDGNTPARATPSGQFAEEIESKSSGPLVEAPERNQVGIHRMGSRYTQ